MTWSVDASLNLGDMEVGAISKHTCSLRTLGPNFVGSGRKYPVLVLVKTRGDISGFDLNGNPVARPEIERQFPGAINAFESAQ